MTVFIRSTLTRSTLARSTLLLVAAFASGALVTRSASAQPLPERLDRPAIADRSVVPPPIDDPEIADGGFELGTPNPHWLEFSESFSSVLCDVARCGDGLGTARPRKGDGWAWFGGFPGAERSWIEQTLDIPVSYYFQPVDLLEGIELWIRHGAASGNGRDVLRVLLDDHVLYELVDGDSPPTPRYRRLRLTVPPDLSAEPRLRIECETFGPGVSNFSIDDLAIVGPLAPRDLVEIPTLGALGAVCFVLLLALCGYCRLARCLS